MAVKKPKDFCDEHGRSLIEGECIECLKTRLASSELTAQLQEKEAAPITGPVRVDDPTFRNLMTEAREVRVDLQEDMLIEHHFTDSEYNKMRELMILLSDPQAARRFPTWQHKAQYLKVPIAQINKWRATRLYRRMLVGIVKVLSLEATIDAIPAMAASAGSANSSAFKAVLNAAQLSAKEERATKKEDEAAHGGQGMVTVTFEAALLENLKTRQKQNPPGILDEQG